MPALAALLGVAITSVAATLGLGAAPAAATCATASGVSVVVDFDGLGGGLETSCVANGGGQSAAELSEVHHDLTRVTQSPGAVCRVDGLPVDVDCSRMPPADAFWGLFWSDGSGGWVFSSEGVDSLDVPAGGSVGWAWQTGGEPKEYPGVEPPQHESPSPSPEPTTPSGSDGGTSTGSGEGAGGGGGGSAAPQPGPSTAPSESAESTASSPSASNPSSGATTPAEDARARKKARKDRDERTKRDRHAAPTIVEAEDDPSVTATQPPADAASNGSGRLPTWVTVVVLAVLALVAAAGMTVRRRRVG
jgi:hypothetical protein